MRERLKPFRMPLNRERRRAEMNAFDRLDNPLPRHRDNPQAAAKSLRVNRLVVTAVYGFNFPKRFRKLRCGDKAQAMQRVLISLMLVLFSSLKN